MYQFALNMWIMRRVTETWVNGLVTKNLLTRAEADMILATPQI